MIDMELSKKFIESVRGETTIKVEYHVPHNLLRIRTVRNGKRNVFPNVFFVSSFLQTKRIKRFGTEKKTDGITRDIIDLVGGPAIKGLVNPSS